MTRPLLALLCCALLWPLALTNEGPDPQPELPLADLSETLPARLHIPFTLTRELDIFPEPLHSSGALVIDRERNAVRWHFADEVTLLLVDDHLRRFDAEGSEEIVALDRDPGAKALKQQMMAFRDGDWSLLSSLLSPSPLSPDSERPAGAQADDHILVLQPATDELARILTTVTIILRGPGPAPRQVIMASTSGDRTTYTFAEPEVVESFPDHLFTEP